MRQDANFLREYAEEQVGNAEETNKIAKVPISFPTFTPLSSELSTDLEKRGHGKKNRDVEVE